MRTRCASVGRNWSAHHIQAASRLHRVRAFGSRTRWKARTRAAAASSDETQQQESDDHASSSSTTSVAPLRKRMREAAVDPLLVAHIRSLDLGFRRGSRDRRRGQRGVAPTMARRVPKWRRPKLLAQASTPSDFPSTSASTSASASSSAKGSAAAPLPEVAFAGRSNVGKSSLLNALSLSLCGAALNAGVSDRPGETTSVDFYRVRGSAAAAADGGRTPLLVDLPGRGFAFGRPEVVETWVATTDAYLRQRETLRAVYLLLDARHGVKAHDRVLLEMLSVAQVPVSLVLTKCDLVQPRVLAKVAALVQGEMRSSPFGDVVVEREWPLLVSSKAGAGMEELSAEIEALAA